MTDDLLRKAADRVLARSVHSDVPVGGEPCWVYTGHRSEWGYGRVAVGSSIDGSRRTSAPAHRIVYLALVGGIPDGFQIDHLCSTRSCVNPSHLEPVTPRENTLRSRGVTSANARKAECVKGHPFDAANTYIDTRGSRQCRACGAERARQYKRRQREGVAS
jgi:hypothetical protein